ncbi:hypothetical protein BJ138DRAFT_130585 [Hygrophoropsis aurantiaca]|uniref:Uncharacterized protein n=1 Tax=Hygrophoropsis aurantiaca TaxID=72124 RepID=A0ACB8AB16_9AGAM|nr:hypothetical protein BJ138DRAFT_130585 [Hygrophoropsis aurantiaca]
MPWYSPPTRQEITLILFCLTTFILFYNVESSFQYLGTNPTSLSKIGKPVDLDGNTKLGASGDALEKEIYGDWDGYERTRAKKSDDVVQKRAVVENKPGVMKENAPPSQRPEIYGDVAVGDSFSHWGAQVPQASMIKHVPGFTILDNVIMANGTIFLVSDKPSSLPSLGSIASSAVNSNDPPREEDWQILSTKDAKTKLGSYGGLIHGVSLLSTDTTPSNYTLFSLWRVYSSLDPSITSEGQTSLPPPRRIFFPNIPTFTGVRPDLNGPIILRHRSPSGFHPLLPKAAFPTLGLMYQEDWEDYARMQLPFVLKRVVVADKGAAARAQGGASFMAKSFSGAEMTTSQHWWEPIRRSLGNFLDVDQAMETSLRGTDKPTITYISTQDTDSAPALRSVDHDALVKAIEKMGRDYSCNVNIVSSEGSWTDRMSAIAKSTIVLGVFGDTLADSVFMKPSSHSMVVEIFAPDVFIPDAEVAVRSLGLHYVAWRDNQPFKSGSFPSTTPASSTPIRNISVDTNAIIQTIRKEFDSTA